MIITCPSCLQTGKQEKFLYLGNQQSKCGFCSSILENACLCPVCGDIMIAKHSLASRMFPVIAVIKTFTDNLEVICRSCRHKVRKSDFRNAYIYGKNVCIAIYEPSLKAFHYYFYDYYNGTRLTNFDEVLRCNVIAFDLIIEIKNDEYVTMVWPVLEVKSNNPNVIVPPSLANRGDFKDYPLVRIEEHAYNRKYELWDCLNLLLNFLPEGYDQVGSFLNSEIELFLKSLRYHISNSDTVLEIEVNRKIDPKISFLNQNE